MSTPEYILFLLKNAFKERVGQQTSRLVKILLFGWPLCLDIESPKLRILSLNTGKDKNITEMPEIADKTIKWR